MGKQALGRVRDAIVDSPGGSSAPATVPDIRHAGRRKLGCYRFGSATLVHADCFEWLAQREPNSIEAVATDPPYGLLEYSSAEQQKLRIGKGGVWRVPPSFDGHRRAPLPRFTTLTPSQLSDLQEFFRKWGRLLLRVLVPDANLLVASNPLLSHLVACALTDAGLERRGEIVRLVMTMRGGDRPKNAHAEFADVTVMPRSMWEGRRVRRRLSQHRHRIRSALRRRRTSRDHAIVAARGCEERRAAGFSCARIRLSPSIRKYSDVFWRWWHDGASGGTDHAKSQPVCH